MTEEWRQAPGWPGYEVSDLGRVRSLDRLLPIRESKDGRRGYNRRRSARYLKLYQHYNGYITVGLAPGRKSVLVNRLVCCAFNGPIPSEGYHADHINGVRSDNRAINLRWLDPSDNRSLRNLARGDRSGVAKLRTKQVQDIFLRLQSSSNRQATIANLAVEYAVTRKTIRNIFSGKNWAHVTCRIRVHELSKGQHP